MIASVIVDVKNHQVNRAFDYLVPDVLLDIIEIGSRVRVSFGTRVIFGYVIELKENSDFKNLKPVIDVLDMIPPLNKEMLYIAKKIAFETNTFYISVLEAMLPSTLKGKYVKYITLVNEESSLKDIFVGSKKMELDEKNQDLLRKVKKEINLGNIELTYEAFDKRSFLEEAFVHLEDASYTHKNEKQRLVIEYLKRNDDTLKSSILGELQITDSVLKTLEKNKAVSIYKKEKYREIKHVYEIKDKVVSLNNHQLIAYNEIKSYLNSYKEILLHGVTGSGKTEIYLEIIGEVIKEGKTAIILVPEISLTPQMINRFKGRFGSKVALLHSALNQNEKYDEWRRLQRGEARIALGARSAIFAPIKNIGVIIIDEAHEGSYKQDENPRYNAKRVGSLRAEYNNSLLILGSATPTVEDYYRALNNEMLLIKMDKRANNALMPKIDVVNMGEELRNGNKSMFSRLLREKIEDRLSKGEQIILLLNRRGHSQFVMCRECGEVIKCKNCDVTLTYHQAGNYLKCHYCGYQIDNVLECPKCNSKHIRYVGIGTEKVVEAINKEFPNASVIRMDADNTKTKNAHEYILDDFNKQKASILVGTQMIAKGLDFPNVTLVGILMADMILRLPDYRSSERTFELISQVSGRAGRHSKKGEVVVQSYTTDHFSIEKAAKNDYEGFYKEELHIRKLGSYPPFSEIVQIVVSYKNYNNAFNEAILISNYLKENLNGRFKILGPSQALIKVVNNNYRVVLTIKHNCDNIDQVLFDINNRYQNHEMKVIVDKNPIIL